MKELVVCKFAGCNQVYTDARILPCGNRTCAAHLEAMMLKNDDMDSWLVRGTIRCHFCEEMHAFPENGKNFPVDRYIPHLLSIRYSFDHEEAKKSLSELTQLLDKLTKLDKEDYVMNLFEQIAANILQEKELNIQKLVAYYDKLVEDVHARKVKCLHNLKINTSLESELEAIKQKTEQLDFILKTLDGDEYKWKEIQSECHRLLERVESVEEELPARIVADQMTEFKPSTCTTPIEEMCGRLDFGTIDFDSTIASSEMMKSDLVTLCNMSGKRLKLVYRASRDGFEASSFHAKCDNQPRTLTLIKTTKGFIFGAYIDVTWDSSSRHKADPNAFIFSLVNPSMLPQYIPIQTTIGKTAVYCFSDHGPVFGAYDICIKNNSNASEKSYSDLGQSYDFKISSQSQSFLAGSPKFQTAEIEVFCS